MLDWVFVTLFLHLESVLIEKGQTEFSVCANSSCSFREQMRKAGLLEQGLSPLALDVHSVFAQSKSPLF